MNTETFIALNQTVIRLAIALPLIFILGLFLGFKVRSCKYECGQAVAAAIEQENKN